MNTRKLLALGIALAFTSLASAGFAADQKAAPAQPPASTAQAPAGGDQGTPAKPTKSKKQKHKKPAPAPETKG
jgi:hypothetical protein